NWRQRVEAKHTFIIYYFCDGGMPHLRSRRVRRSRAQERTCGIVARFDRRRRRMTTPPLNTAPPSFRLDDRLIVVTGSAEGIGRAFAEGFAQSGAHVVLASRRREKLEEVQQAITTRGGRADVVQTDLTRLADIAALGAVVRKLAQGNERRIVLVNNAGYGFTKAAIEVTEADWNSVFDVHVKGAFFCAQQLAPLMIERGYGKIINMSSTWSALTDVGKSAYCAAKAAVSHLNAQLATDWASDGIRVNAIAP